MPNTKIKTDDDEDKIVKDGQVLRVPLLLMDAQTRERVKAMTFDATNHRPHFASISDVERAKRQTAVAIADKQLSDRWRNPSPVLDTAPSAAVEALQMTQVKAPAPTDMNAIYAKRDRDLENRWRKGGTIA